MILLFSAARACQHHPVTPVFDRKRAECLATCGRLQLLLLLFANLDSRRSLGLTALSGIAPRAPLWQRKCKPNPLAARHFRPGLPRRHPPKAARAGSEASGGTVTGGNFPRVAEVNEQSAPRNGMGHVAFPTGQGANPHALGGHCRRREMGRLDGRPRETRQQLDRDILEKLTIETFLSADRETTEGLRRMQQRPSPLSVSRLPASQCGRGGARGRDCASRSAPQGRWRA